MQAEQLSETTSTRILTGKSSAAGHPLRRLIKASIDETKRLGAR
jgi:hypothetical protein